MEMLVTPLYGKIQDAYESGHKVFCLEGSTRSGKNYAVNDFIITYFAANAGKGLIFDIFRKTYADLRKTTEHSFRRRLKELNLYDVNQHNKTEHSYHIFGNLVRFAGLDDSQKLHGYEGDFAWIDEAVEATFSSYKQIIVRHKGRMFLTWNPSVTQHWIFDKVLKNPDTFYSHSTYKQNSFLDVDTVSSIEETEPTPENIERGTAWEWYWQVYGLGLRVPRGGTIVRNFQIVESVPPDAVNVGYYLDFGFANDPTAMGEVWIEPDYFKLTHRFIKEKNRIPNLYVKEHIYKTGLLNVTGEKSILNAMRLCNINPKNVIVADSAEVKSIGELRAHGYNVVPAKKPPGSISKGIGLINIFRVNIVGTDNSILYEAQNYVYKEDKAKDKLSNDPIDDFNHHIDGIRYKLFYLYLKGKIR